MISAETLRQVPNTYFQVMDQNPRAAGSDAGENSQSYVPLADSTAHPQHYGFMQMLSSAQAGQQLDPAALLQLDPRLQQSVAAGQAQRRSFDMSALQLPGSPGHTSQQQQQQQQQAPAFPTAQMRAADSGVGLGAKPGSQHGMQQAPSNRSSICSVSDNAGIPSPLQEQGGLGASDIALLLSGALHVRPNTSGKPPYPYATLITYAILQHPRKQMTLSEIYAWLIHHYPYFATAGSGWKNSIRHNLSLNKMFLRIPRPINEPGKGAYWTVDLAILDEVLNAKPKPAIHHYSPSGALRSDAIPPISSAAPSLTLTTPGAGPSANPHAPPLAGLSSSISDKGMLVETPDAMPARRASLQAMPVHRFQPYTMHPPQQGSAAQLPPSLYSPGDFQLADAQSRSFYPQPAFPVPFSGSAMVPAGFAMPSSALAGSAAPAHAANPPAFPADPQGNLPGSLSAHVPLASGAFGRMAAPLSLRTSLQVRPTPSLPEHLLSAHQRDSISPSAQSSMANSPVAAGEARQPDAPSIGDLSAYFAFVDSQGSSSKPT
ncbi:hypothetical protein EV183_001123 [Coemansia sp. RSA 2336]|nr:hypothetical protein EV183_001123 [Coemansia sp. RSA 2336]